MTYAELLEFLKTLSPEQLETNVTVLISGENEYFPVDRVFISNESDVLDDGHPVLNSANE